MSTLIAASHRDVATAQTVLTKLADMQRRELIRLLDAVVVDRRPDGKVELHQTNSLASVSAAAGAPWGGLIGLLLFAPLLGMAGETGAEHVTASGSGVDEAFPGRLGAELAPGSAALVLLVEAASEDTVLDELNDRYTDGVIRTSLSDEQEARLRQSIEQTESASPPGLGRLLVGGLYTDFCPDLI